MNQSNSSPTMKQKFIKIPESLTLLDPQRQRNLGKNLLSLTDQQSSLSTSSGIARRKLDIDVNTISRALNK